MLSKLIHGGVCKNSERLLLPWTKLFASATEVDEPERLKFGLPNKTGLVFTINSANEPGVLYKALNVLARHNINLTRIESKPSKEVAIRRATNFFIDFYGGISDANV